MSSCCTLRLKRRRAFSRDSPSCSRTSAKLTHPQTRPVGPNSYYKDLTVSQGEDDEIPCIYALKRFKLGNNKLIMRLASFVWEFSGISWNRTVPDCSVGGEGRRVNGIT